MIVNRASKPNMMLSIVIPAVIMIGFLYFKMISFIFQLFCFFVPIKQCLSRCRPSFPLSHDNQLRESRCVREVSCLLCFRETNLPAKSRFRLLRFASPGFTRTLATLRPGERPFLRRGQLLVLGPVVDQPALAIDRPEARGDQFGGAATVPPLLDEGTGLALDPERVSAWISRERPDAVIFERRWCWASRFSTPARRASGIAIARSIRTRPSPSWPR